jgi:hypothetical protein
MDSALVAHYPFRIVSDGVIPGKRILLSPPKPIVIILFDSTGGKDENTIMSFFDTVKHFLLIQ